MLFNYQTLHATVFKFKPNSCMMSSSVTHSVVQSEIHDDDGDHDIRAIMQKIITDNLL